MPVKKIEVDDDNSGRRLDNFLLSVYKNVPKSKIYNIIRKGEVRINSGRVKPHRKIELGDIIRIPPYLDSEPTIDRHEPQASSKLINELKNQIIFEDQNYIILNKPHGIAVHGGTKSFVGVISVMRSLYDNNIDLCHRIDKETSGCLVLSKNKKSNRHFNESIVNKNVKKKYLAIVKGHLSKTLKVNSSIEKSFDTQTKSFISETGKKANSIFRPISKLNAASLVEVEISTGRTHQIRLQGQEIGHPVVNDDKYGDREFNKKDILKKNKRMGLHSQIIEFKDQNNKTIKVKAEPDSSFKSLIELLS